MLHHCRLLFCGLLSLLLLSGCATSQYGQQITAVHYYPTCYAPINDLRQADSSFNKSVAGGAALGTLTGALIGYLATGKAEGALVGAATGAVVGTAAGYAKAKQDRIADDNRRMASYLVDIDGDISGIDRATAAARVARDCYDREFKQAVASFQNGNLTREELARRYAEIKDGCTEAGRILGNVIVATADKETQYREALVSEAERANRPVPVAAVQPEAPVTQPAAVTAQTEQQTTRVAKKTPRPKQDDTSLEAVAQNTQRLNESRRAAEDEQALLLQMQAEMDGTLATLIS